MTRITRIRTQMAVPFPSVSIREIRGQKSSHFAQIFIDSSTEEKITWEDRLDHLSGENSLSLKFPALRSLLAAHKAASPAGASPAMVNDNAIQ